jgi:AraC-like DNA-binding protein
VPDACLDFLFDLTGDAAEVVGTMTRPLPVHRGPTMDLLGVRFRPGGIGAFLRLPADDLTDGVVSLADVWGPDANLLFSRLQEALATTDRVALLDQALLGRIGATPGDPVALDAAALIERAGGRIRVDDLARAAGLGRRQLERRFLAAVGIAPKVACRVLRFQAALRRIADDPAVSLAAIAVEAGYHDQAHLTRDFTALAGTPPGAWRLARENGDDAFVQDVDAGGG